MATSAQQIDAVRSGKGQVKGFLTKDTMYRLRQAVADHKKAGDKGYQARLGVILGLCDTYIGRHGTETDDRAREKLEVVEQIKAEALAEGSRRQAEAVYVRDVYAGAPGGGVASGSKFRGRPREPRFRPRCRPENLWPGGLVGPTRRDSTRRHWTSSENMG